jgi:hypothetical protein
MHSILTAKKEGRRKGTEEKRVKSSEFHVQMPSDGNFDSFCCFCLCKVARSEDDSLYVYVTTYNSCSTLLA